MDVQLPAADVDGCWGWRTRKGAAGFVHPFPGFPQSSSQPAEVQQGTNAWLGLLGKWVFLSLTHWIFHFRSILVPGGGWRSCERGLFGAAQWNRHTELPRDGVINPGPRLGFSLLFVLLGWVLINSSPSKCHPPSPGKVSWEQAGCESSHCLETMDKQHN